MSPFADPAWAIEPAAARALESLMARESHGEAVALPPLPLAAERVDAGGGVSYLRTDQGLAVFRVSGVMTKYSDPFFEMLGIGGASSVAIKRQIRAARVDPKVRGAIAFVDSPGGQVAGTQELSDEVAAFASDKPFHVHADDLIASAAYWAMAPATSISINKSGEAGSIGVMAAIADSSAAAEQAGFRVHLIATGKHKGAGTPGVPITESQLAAITERIEAKGRQFADAVASARGLDAEAIAGIVDDGGVYGADEAMRLGLVDHVRSAEDSIAAVVAEVSASAERDASARSRRVRSATLGL